MIVPIATAETAEAAPTRETNTLPVVPLVMPSAELVLPTRDLRGLAAVVKQKKRIDVTLDANILFAKDSAAIRPAARARLVQVARQVQSYGAGLMLVQGYTDDLGSTEHGLVLSGQRARAVADLLRPFLAARGVRFTVQGLGETNFVASNKTEAGRRKNRRVELHFTAR